MQPTQIFSLQLLKMQVVPIKHYHALALAELFPKVISLVSRLIKRWGNALALCQYCSCAEIKIQQYRHLIAPKSLSNTEVYQVVAYVLHLHGIVERDFVLDSNSLPQVKMPNSGNFIDRSQVQQ